MGAGDPVKGTPIFYIQSYTLGTNKRGTSTEHKNKHQPWTGTVQINGGGDDTPTQSLGVKFTFIIINLHIYYVYYAV